MQQSSGTRPYLLSQEATQARRFVWALVTLCILGSCGCQNAPFTSCIEDGTPCTSPVTTSTMSTSGVVAQSTVQGTSGDELSPPSAESSATTVGPSGASSLSDAYVATEGSFDGGLPNNSLDATMVPPQVTVGNDSTEPLTGTATNTLAPDDAGAAGPGSSADDSTSDEATSPSLPDASLGESLIVNGDFADDESGWKVEQTSGRAGVTGSIQSGTLCVQSQGNVDVTVGWPADPSDSIYLTGGRYQLSFRARGDDTNMNVKVGHAYDPYTAIHEFEWSAADAEWSSTNVVFTTQGDDAAGLAFFITLNGNRLCLDDVALRSVNLD